MLIGFLGIFHQSWHLRFWLFWKNPFVRRRLYTRRTQAKLSVGSNFNYDSRLLWLSGGHNLAPWQILSQKRKIRLETLPSPQLTLLKTPLIHSGMGKDLHLRRLWRNIYCREQCGAEGSSLWGTELSYVALGSIMTLFLAFLLYKPQQVQLMFSLDHSSSLMWSKSVGGNSWGLRKYDVDFLYLGTNISPFHSPTTLPFSETLWFFIQSNWFLILTFIWNSCSVSCDVIEKKHTRLEKSKNVDGEHFALLLLLLSAMLTTLIPHIPIKEKLSRGHMVSHLSTMWLAYNYSSVCSLGRISSHPTGSGIFKVK